MMNQVVDQDIRNRALSPGESFIIQAPAGSGKTELLVQRFLRLLSTVSSPEEVIAITFTRKAAAEMRGRILHSLETASRQADSDLQELNPSKRLTLELARAVIAQDNKHAWNLFNNPTRLRIQTIDSLCTNLTRHMPVLSGFGAQPETIDDAHHFYQEAAENTLAELESGKGWSDAIATFLAHLDNNLPRARDLLADMLARRDQWLRHMVDLNDREELENALKNVVQDVLQESREKFPDGNREEFLSCISLAGKNKEWLDKNLTELPHAVPTELDTWKHIVDLCLTQKNTWRKTVNVRNGFPPGKENSEAKTLFKNILAELSANNEITDLFIYIKNLPSINYSDQEWKIIQALSQLLVLADAQLRLLFAESNQVDFAGVSLASLAALGNAQQPTELALHLDYQIHHILVDEFQDISINQYLLLDKLTQEWVQDSENTLFLVGDPMQSIYRFREAEVGLFIQTWETRKLGNWSVVPLNIEMNFRSSSSLVDWVNSVFLASLPEISNITTGAVHFTPALAYSQDVSDQSVSIHAIPRDHEDDAPRIIVNEINESRQSNPGGSIAILVRSRRHLQDIIPELKSNKIDFRAVDIEGLGQRGVIQDLLALTRALCHPGDRIAWLALLRSPWCGLTLNEIYDLTLDKSGENIWEILESIPEGVFEEETRQRLSRFIAVIQTAFDHKKNVSLTNWVKTTWVNLGGAAVLTLESDIENVLTYFDLLAGHEKGGGLESRFDFIEEVEKLYAQPEGDAENAVQIMTIHKSKGLEFDTVILPGLSSKSSADDEALLMWSELQHDNRQELILAGVKETGDENSPIYNYLKFLKREKNKYENGRVMYVANTRAKSKLVLVADFDFDENDDIKPPASNTLLATIWPAVSEVFQQHINAYESPQQTIKSQTDALSINLRRLKTNWSLPVCPEDISWDAAAPVIDGQEITQIEFEWAGEIIKHTGTVVHQTIQWIAEKGEGSWLSLDQKYKNAFIYSSLKRKGVPEGEEILQACKRVDQAIHNMLISEKGQWILSNSYNNIKNEYALSGVYNGKLVNVILDRTFIDQAGYRWIIDYKSSRHDEADIDSFLDQQQDRYRPQLEKYASIIRLMEPNPIKLGLYFPLLDGWREWSYTE